jgi:hypothetical protein
VVERFPAVDVLDTVDLEQLLLQEDCLRVQPERIRGLESEDNKIQG